MTGANPLSRWAEKNLVIPLWRMFVLTAVAWATLGTLGRVAHAVPLAITYTDVAGYGFNDAKLGAVRRTALEASASNWASRLSGTVPIAIKAHFESLGGSLEEGAVLAFAAPTTLASNFTNAPVKDTAYNIALANQLAGTDLVPTGTAKDELGNDISNDIDITFNVDLDANSALGPIHWYYGLDGNPPVLGTGADGTPITQVDFYSTALHELGHGLGFIALIQPNGSFPSGTDTAASVARSGTRGATPGQAAVISPTPISPGIFDRFLANGQGSTAQRLTGLPISLRAAALISDRLYFSGLNARVSQGGLYNPRLYAPNPYEPGSSVSHLDEDTYHGVNELITPFSSGVAHDPGPVMTGIFRDLGWTIADSNPTPIPTPTEPPNTASALIAFVSNRDGNNEIYIINANGTGLKNLTSNSANDRQPALSPDGSKIAFVSNRSGDNEIYVMGIDSLTLDPLPATLKRVTNSPGDDLDPSWSPDGTEIAFSSVRSGNADIWRARIDGTGTPQNLTNNTFNDIQPSWSPNGAAIVFVSDRNGNQQIYAIPAGGGTGTRITSNKLDDSQPSWNSASNKIAYISSNGSTSELITLRLDVIQGAQLTDNFAVESSPSYSPTTDQIAFASDLNGNSDIYLVNGDGTNTIRLTKSPAQDSDPSWGGGRASTTPTPTPIPGTGNPTPTPIPGAPSNNNFVAAQPISGLAGDLTTSVPEVPATAMTNVNANKETGEPLHGGNAGGASIWFRWEAPQSGSVSFDTVDSSFDTLLGIYTGSAVNALRTIGGNDDSFITTEGKASRVTFNVTQGTVYYIAVDGFGGASGSVSLTWAVSSSPANDNFANARILTGTSGALVAGTDDSTTNINATKQVGEPNHAGNPGGASVWYKWTPPVAGESVVDLSGSTFDTILAVYTGNSVDHLTLATPNSFSDDSSPATNTSRATWIATANTTYYIAVDGYSGAAGNINLSYVVIGRQPLVTVRQPTGSASHSQVQFPTRGAQTPFYFQITNLGNIADTYKVTAQNLSANPGDFTATYYDALVGGNSITPQITSAAGLSLGPLEPGETRDIRLEVLVGQNAPLDTPGNFRLTASSPGTITTTTDSALAQVRPVNRLPDALVQINGSPPFIGDGVYNDINRQTVTQTARRPGGVIYLVRVQNDGSLAEQYVLTGTPTDNNFTVSYFASDGTNITSTMSTPTGQTADIGLGDYTDVYVVVTPLASAPSGSSKTVLVTAASAADRTRLDVVGMVTVAGVMSPAPVIPATDPARPATGDVGSNVQLSSAGADAASSTIALSFAGALDTATATDSAHYRVTVNRSVVPISQARYSVASQTVSLMLPPGTLKTGGIAQVQWVGLRDASGRLLKPGTISIRTR